MICVCLLHTIMSVKELKFLFLLCVCMCVSSKYNKPLPFLRLGDSVIELKP